MTPTKWYKLRIMSNSHDKMQDIYEQNKGLEINTDKYKGVVSGFHFAWDDSDKESIIIAITEPKRPYIGIKYFLRGDVHVTHKQCAFGYDYISLMDFLILTSPTG